MLRFTEFNEAATRSLSRLHGHIDRGRAVGFVSAHRGDASPAENNKAHKALKSDMKKRGLSYSPVQGEYVEDHEGKKIKVKEKTLMVTHKDHKKLHAYAKQLGRIHNQDAVLTVSKKHGSNFHGTGTSTWIKKGESQRIGGAGITDVKHRTAKRDFGTALGGKSFVAGGDTKKGRYTGTILNPGRQKKDSK